MVAYRGWNARDKILVMIFQLAGIITFFFSGLMVYGLVNGRHETEGWIVWPCIAAALVAMWVGASVGLGYTDLT
jgi:hypothetical protein